MRTAAHEARRASPWTEFKARPVSADFPHHGARAAHVRLGPQFETGEHRERCDHAEKPAQRSAATIVEAGKHLCVRTAGLVVHQAALSWYGSLAAGGRLGRAHAAISWRLGDGRSSKRRDSSLCVGTRDGQHDSGGL